MYNIKKDKKQHEHLMKMLKKHFHNDEEEEMENNEQLGRDAHNENPHASLKKSSYHEGEEDDEYNDIYSGTPTDDERLYGESEEDQSGEEREREHRAEEEEDEEDGAPPKGSHSRPIPGSRPSKERRKKLAIAVMVKKMTKPKK